MAARVFLTGVGVAPFGKQPATAPAALGGRAVRDALSAAGVAPADVEVGYGGSSYGGMLLAQRVLQQAAISGPPIFTVEDACASGAAAVHLAWQSVAAGAARVAVAFGVEQLSVFGGGTLPLTTGDIELDQGVVMPATYAMRAQRYLHDFHATAADLDNVSVKNRGNGALNPRAHFQQAVTPNEVADSRPIADPLRLLHCCPNTDGAAAVVLMAESEARASGRPLVEVRASVIRSGKFHTGYRDMTWPDITARAATAAYVQAKLSPADLDLVELHDAFSISELLHAEALGIAPRGEAYKALADGQFHRDGRVAVSPSGGLLSRGHPVGASGVAQIAETYWQLTGQAGPLQVPGAEIGLCHVTGGGIFGVDNGACGVHILAAV